MEAFALSHIHFLVSSIPAHVSYPSILINRARGPFVSSPLASSALSSYSHLRDTPARLSTAIAELASFLDFGRCIYLNETRAAAAFEVLQSSSLFFAAASNFDPNLALLLHGSSRDTCFCY